MVILHTWRWYRLNEVQGINLSFKHTIMPTYIGIGFNAVLPGSVGGDFVRLYFILKEFPKKKSAAILSILVDRINGLMGIIVIACLTAPYYFETYRNNDALFYILLTCFGICLGGAAAFFICTSLLSKNSAFSKKLMHRLASTRFAETASSLIEAIHVYRHAKLIILESLIVSISTQLLLLLVVTIIGKMMGLPPVSPFDYMIALVIGQIANLVPLTPGGIGVGEAAFANILMLLNPGTTAAYATAFLALRILSTATYLPGVFIGIFGFHLLRSKAFTSNLNTVVNKT
jgi:uncharacterized protein (TIRG00374 family)